MRKSIFRLLAKISKMILPRYSGKDLTRLNKIDKAVIALRYWITIHSL